MKTSEVFVFSLFLLAMVLVQNSAEAVQISYNFTGIIYQGPAPEFEPGTTVSGSFTYDTVATDENSDPRFGEYIIPNGSMSVNLSTGVNIETDSENSILGMGINNESSSDSFTYKLNFPVVSGATRTIRGVLVELTDQDATVFSDDSIPFSLNLLDFEISEFIIIYRTPEFPRIGYVYASIDSLTPINTATWDGFGVDSLASNPDNWSGNFIPQNGDNVVFDSTSTKDCIWDLNLTLPLLILNSGYTGTFTLNSNLSITKNLIISDGTFIQNENLEVGF